MTLYFGVFLLVFKCLSEELDFKIVRKEKYASQESNPIHEYSFKESSGQ